MAAWWLICVSAAIGEPYPQLTGKRNNKPYPSGSKELTALTRWRVWHNAITALLLPNKYWLPTKQLNAFWLLAVGTALVSYTIPVSEMFSTWGGLANTFCGFALVACWFGNWCAHRDEFTPMPDVSVVAALRARKTMITLIGITLGGAATAIVISGLVAAIIALPGRITFIVGLTIISLALCSWVVAGKQTLEPWHKLISRRVFWTPVWERIKKIDPFPVLISTTELGTATVDIFDLGTGTGFIEGAPGKTLLAPQVGAAGVNICVLPVWDVDDKDAPPAKQQRIPGTVHPSQVRIVSIPGGQIAPLDDASTPPEVAGLTIECAISATLAAAGWLNPTLYECINIAAEQQAQPIWATRFNGAHPRSGLGQLGEVQYRASFAATLGVPFLVDANNQTLYVGTDGLQPATLNDDAATKFLGDNPVQALDRLSKADLWWTRWNKTMKGAAAPSPQWQTEAENEIAPGLDIYELSFVVWTGVEVAPIIKESATLATTMGKYRTVKMLNYVPIGDTQGSRNELGLTVVWASFPLPTPSALPDFTTEITDKSPAFTCNRGAHLAMRVLVANAFEDARLARPEVIAARAWTGLNNKAYTWEVKLRLYDGVTLSDLRGKANKLQNFFQAEWLRLEYVAPGIVYLYVGADPETVKVIPSRVSQAKIDGLNWDGAWTACKVVNKAGLSPQRVACKPLPGNDLVTEVDFRLPAGIGPREIDRAWPAVKSAVKSVYTELHYDIPEAGMLRVVSASKDPMPASVGFDWKWITDHRDQFALGAAMDGSVVSWDTKVSPHILIAGLTGSGKSVATQSIVSFAIANGWEVYVCDPTKQAIDFRFATPWLSGIAPASVEDEQPWGIEQTLALLRYLYAKCGQRKALRGQYGAGNITRLPEELRPPRVLLVIDELTSLITPEKPGPATDDPDAEAEREKLMAIAAQKAKIGVLIGKIARESRSEGVSLLLATQELKKETAALLPADLKGQLARALLGASAGDWGARMSTLRHGETAPRITDPGAGRGLWESVTATTAQMFQGWYNVGEGDYLAEILAGLVPPVTEKADLSPWLAGRANSDSVEVLELDEIDLGDIDLGEIDLDDLADESSQLSGDAPAPQGEVIIVGALGRKAIPIGTDGGIYGHPVLEVLAQNVDEWVGEITVPPGALDGVDAITGESWLTLAQEIVAGTGSNLTSSPPSRARTPTPP